MVGSKPYSKNYSILKKVHRTNTLAYSVTKSAPEKKKFITIDTCGRIRKHFTLVTYGCNKVSYMHIMIFIKLVYFQSLYQCTILVLFVTVLSFPLINTF
jgi:hypothetical protein